jgi:tRNA-specific 2-thiouridylase
MKIAVLVSGGVDSAVALRLLKDEGHDLTAFYLKIWLEDELSYLGECPWEEDLSYVQKICSEIDVPLEVVPMQQAYWDRVVQYTVAEAKIGRTPNPDVLCNQQIKFGQFYEIIDNSFEKVATGHYAQVCFSRRDEACLVPTLEQTAPNVEGQYILKRAPDPVKDQTYFLSQLTQKQLSRALFPIGQYTKKEVRELAKKYNLPNQDRKDSQGICFLGKIPFREFLKHHLDEMPGDFIDVDTREKVGEHLGYWFYTIGQRQGLGLGGGPWFVVKKDVKQNIVYLANGYSPEEVYQGEFEVAALHWITPELKDKSEELRVKIRHGAVDHPCTLKVEGKSGHVTLKEKVHGVAPGQFAVFYDGEVCLGGGVIN